MAVALAEHGPDALVPGRVLLNDRAQLRLLRAIIGDAQFPIPIDLPGHAFDSCAQQILRRVVDRHDDGDERFPPQRRQFVLQLLQTCLVGIVPLYPALVVAAPCGMVLTRQLRWGRSLAALPAPILYKVLEWIETPQCDVSIAGNVVLPVKARAQPLDVLGRLARPLPALKATDLKKMIEGIEPGDLYVRVPFEIQILVEQRAQRLALLPCQSVADAGGALEWWGSAFAARKQRPGVRQCMFRIGKHRPHGAQGRRDAPGCAGEQRLVRSLRVFQRYKQSMRPVRGIF